MLLERINVEDSATHEADRVTLMDSLLIPLNVEAVMIAGLSGPARAHGAEC